MQHRFLLIAAVLALVGCGSRAQGGLLEDVYGTEVKDAGARLLAGAGMNAASDISFAVIQGYQGYKITWQDDPDLIRALYTALRSAYFSPQSDDDPSPWDSMVLRLRSGVNFCRFFHEPKQGTKSGPAEVHLGRHLCSKGLHEVLKRIRRNAKAASRDARIGGFDIAAMEVAAPGETPSAIDPSSPRWQTLLARAQALADCVDLRTVGAVEQAEDDILKIGKVLGLLSIRLARPLQVCLSTSSVPPADSDYCDPDFILGLGFCDIACDRITIVATTPDKPRVALHDTRTGYDYLTQFVLGRREGERKGIQKYGFPGHPISDMEYYKKPETMFKELMEIVKAAVAEQKSDH